MVGAPTASAVFDFENILPQLDFLPIAARRALDHAGLRLSLEAWRSLGLEDRCQLVAAGAVDIVDSGSVAAVVRRASPPAQRIEVVGDPDPLAPPDGLTRLLEPVPLDARQWARLRALDRYALAHVHRRSIARNDPSLIQAAYEDIVMGHLRSLRPPPGEAGGRGMGSTTPPAELPPSAMPRSDGGRGRWDVTPSPGFAAELQVQHVEIPVAPRPYEPRGYEMPPRSRGEHEPGSSRGHEAMSRGHDVAPSTSRAHEVAPASRHHHDTTRVPGTTPSLRRPQEAARPAFEAQGGPRSQEQSRGYDMTPSGRGAFGGGAQARGYDLPPVRALEPSDAGLSHEDLHAAELIPLDEATPVHDPIPELTPPRHDRLAPLSSHLNDAGDAHMVDVGEKPVTARRAIASATVHMRRETFRRLSQNDTPKGDVLAAARIAGIQAAKRTSELIPLCHVIALTKVEVLVELDASAGAVAITATAEARDRTGVEMEAMVAASVAGLTIYDMLKGIDREMAISDVKLLEKSGGRTGHFRRSGA